jgi:hypothetical protein
MAAFLFTLLAVLSDNVRPEDMQLSSLLRCRVRGGQVVSAMASATPAPGSALHYLLPSARNFNAAADASAGRGSTDAPLPWILRCDSHLTPQTLILN